MQYTEKELSQLIANVEKEFTAHLVLAKSEDVDSTASLVKAEDEKPAEKKEDKSEEKPEHKEEPKEEKKEAAPAESSKEEKKDEAAPEAKPEHKEEKPAAEHEQHAESSEEDGHDYDEQDMEHMHNMYSSMKRGELKAHHDSVKRALDAKSAPKSGEMEMAKSEDTTVVVQPEIVKPSPEMDLLKAEVEAQKAKNETLQKTLDAVTAFVTKLAQTKAAPQGKAITSMEQIEKSEGSGEEKPLEKTEIKEILLKKSADPKLAKSDRDAINAYYLNGASINTISHLLK